MRSLVDRSKVLEALSSLDRNDRHRGIFGSSSHQYRLNPPLDSAVVDAFESKHQITIPEDYRDFVTQIGNGGAGPWYGLFPFQTRDDGSPWGLHIEKNISTPFPHSQEWNSKFEDDKMLSEDERRSRYALWEQEYFQEDRIAGTFPICHYGCGHYAYLVVSGPQHGFLWWDSRVADDGIRPVLNAHKGRVRFAEWYQSWLDESLVKIRGFSPTP